MGHQLRNRKHHIKQTRWHTLSYNNNNKKKTQPLSYIAHSVPTHSATSHAAWWRQTLAVNTGLRWSAVQVPACDKLSYCYAVRCGYECIKAFTLSSEISPNCWIATKPVFVGFKWFVEAFTYLFWGFSTLSSRDGKNKLSTLFPICPLKVKQKSAALVLCGPPACQ